MYLDERKIFRHERNVISPFRIKIDESELLSNTVRQAIPNGILEVLLSPMKSSQRDAEDFKAGPKATVCYAEKRD